MCEAFGCSMVLSKGFGDLPRCGVGCSYAPVRAVFLYVGDVRRCGGIVGAIAAWSVVDALDAADLAAGLGVVAALNAACSRAVQRLFLRLNRCFSRGVSRQHTS